LRGLHHKLSKLLADDGRLIGEEAQQHGQQLQLDVGVALRQRVPSAASPTRACISTPSHPGAAWSIAGLNMADIPGMQCECIRMPPAYCRGHQAS
jgi:hypothetical protein